MSSHTLASATVSGLSTAQTGLAQRPHPANSWLLRPGSGPCEYSAWSPEPGAQDLWCSGRWTCRGTCARLLSWWLSVNATDQGPAIRTQCAPAVGGFGRGWCRLATRPPPAAPGAAASSDAGLGTWRETQPWGLTDKGGHRERREERGSTQVPGPGDPWLVTSHHLSSTKEREEPGPHPARRLA